MSKLKIDSVKATKEFCKDRNCGINEMNDICFGICGAFAGVNNVNVLDGDCECQCDEMVREWNEQVYGLDHCEKPTPRRPVLWDDVPHFIPQIYRQNEDISRRTALQQCYNMCAVNVPNKLTSCKQNCDIDASAIVHDSQSRERTQTPGEKTTVSGTRRKHPTIFWVGVGFLGIVILFLLFAIIKTISDRR